MSENGEFQKRIDVFQDTQKMITESTDLLRRTRRTQAGSMLYFKQFQAVVYNHFENVSTIEIVEDTTFHCAQKERLRSPELKIAVLNFANAYHPGGGVLEGTSAQEESLCRCSNLYNVLVLPYFLKNYYKLNAQTTGAMGSDSVIYSPGITVVKTDDYKTLPQEDWFDVDVLTCAAPYYDATKKRPVSAELLEEVMIRRITNILEVASAQLVDILMLGAFGCGAFNNPPHMVAGVFRKLLIDKGYGNRFRKVLFAIKKNDANNSNLQAFRDVFE